MYVGDAAALVVGLYVHVVVEAAEGLDWFKFCHRNVRRRWRFGCVPFNISHLSFGFAVNFAVRENHHKARDPEGDEGGDDGVQPVDRKGAHIVIKSFGAVACVEVGVDGQV